MCAGKTAETAAAVPDAARRDTPGVLAALVSRGFSPCLRGFSAIDSYLGRNGENAVHILSGADAADLAKLFEDLRYPGAAIAGAALDSDNETYYFHCAHFESGGAFPREDCRPSFKLLEFYQDCGTRRFYDPQSNYPLLRAIYGKPVQGGVEIDGVSTAALWWEYLNPGAERCRALTDGALILAKYFPETAHREITEIAAWLQTVPEGPPPGIEEQRLVLAGLLSAPNPAAGFELLKSGGFIAAFWPELAVLDDVHHAKEFHPEGNVWKHTLETLRYRKPSARKTACDLRLSLGLLLHDTGKPIAGSAGSRRFNGHAELGESQARCFLERLGFPAALVNDVCYLVRNHMLPAALSRLPLIRTGEIMASPLFPVLLELYRCDESSSFKGLDGYYESSAAYQSFLKNRRNPYRSADGKKLRREQITEAYGGLSK
jgi:poly(A) polymerase